MSTQSNIEVRLTDVSELHCFELTFNAAPGKPGEQREPLVIMLHTAAALELFNQLGRCLLAWMHQNSSDLLARLRQKLKEAS